MLDAWSASPTRLREDAEAEADLRRGGYRDRIFTELVQNAADAAAAAGVDGAVRAWVENADDGSGAAVLHVANTGAPLDADGVASLCALRASAKTDAVGRFGVGFTATTVIADEIEIRSTTGSVEFSRSRTRDAVARVGEPDVGVPVLRLAWPSPTGPEPGWDTEVVLTLSADANSGGGRDAAARDAAALLRSAAAESTDLLLELPAITRIDIDGDVRERVEEPFVPGDGESGDRERRDGKQGDAEPAPGRGVLSRIVIGTETFLSHTDEHTDERARPVRWLVPVGPGGAVRPVGEDVLRAPTRSDEKLSLPALVIADVPMAPDRRRRLPGAELSHLAASYPVLAAAVPADQRTAMIPSPGFPRSDADEELRAAIGTALWDQPWLPTADGGVTAGARAVVVRDLSRELESLLADTVDGLVVADLSGAASVSALASIGVRELEIAELVDLLGGVAREPHWWGELYDGLASLVDANASVSEGLGALPVPLADGRIVTGPRTTVVGSGLTGALSSVTWARLVHPDAARPLLGRLGAGEATAMGLASDPALETLIELTGDLAFTAARDAAAASDAAGTPDPAALADTVLDLVAQADPGADLPSWVGGLLLPDGDGELSPVDELLIPGSPLAEVIAEPSPFGTVAQDVVDSHGVAALRAVGAGWGFTVLRADLPTGPDHDLDDEYDWWHGLDDEPDQLVAVRDLDLIADDRWPQALELLLGDPHIRPLLADRAGYTAWWLRRHARIDGRPLGTYLGDDPAFAGLLDPLDHPEAHALRGVLAGGSVDTADLASVLLAGLADEGRAPTPAVVARTHRAVAEAVADATIAIDDLPRPDGVRTLAGAVVPPQHALIVDDAWAAALVGDEQIVPAERVDDEAVSVLADILDCSLLSETLDTTVESVGRESVWGREPGAVRAAAMQEAGIPAGRVVVHEQLVVRMRVIGGDEDVWRELDGAECAVAWCEDDRGTVHTDESWAVPMHRHARRPD